MRVMSAAGVEHQRDVGNIPCHRAFDPQSVEGLQPLAARYDAWTRPESDNAVEAGRRAQATAEIVSCREPDLATCQSRTGSAGRAAGTAFRMPRVSRQPIHRVERMSARPFRHIRFRDWNRTVLFEAGHGRVGCFGHIIRVNRRAVGCSHTTDVVVVLHGDGEARE